MLTGRDTKIRATALMYPITSFRTFILPAVLSLKNTKTFILFLKKKIHKNFIKPFIFWNTGEVFSGKRQYLRCQNIVNMLKVNSIDIHQWHSLNIASIGAIYWYCDILELNIYSGKKSFSLYASRQNLAWDKNQGCVHYIFARLLISSKNSAKTASWKLVPGLFLFAKN